MPNISAEDRDNNSPVWDMSQERVLMTNLINQRFNFFMVFFSVVIGAAVKAETHAIQTFLLSLGGLIASLLFVTLLQVHARNRAILRILREDVTHPYTIIWSKCKRMYRARDIVPIVIPTICVTTLVVGAILSGASAL